MRPIDVLQHFRTLAILDQVMACHLSPLWHQAITQHIEAETKWPPFRRRHFQMHFFNENVRISINISSKFVPKVPINKIPALVQIMAWRWPGDKPLSEPMMIRLVRLPMHICVTRPQWVNLLRPSDAYMCRQLRTSLVQIMACHLFGTKPLSEVLNQC